MNIIIVSINFICMILLIGVLVIFIIKANKIRFDYKIEKDTVVQKDDDDKWIFGLIYIGTVILLIVVLALSLYL